MSGRHPKTIARRILAYALFVLLQKQAKCVLAFAADRRPAESFEVPVCPRASPAFLPRPTQTRLGNPSFPTSPPPRRHAQDLASFCREVEQLPQLKLSIAYAYKTSLPLVRRWRVSIDYRLDNNAHFCIRSSNARFAHRCLATLCAIGARKLVVENDI